MKIALQVSGQLRHFKSTYNIFYDNFIKSINPDIFVYTWTSPKYTRTKDEGTNDEYIHMFKPTLFKVDISNKEFLLNSGLINNIQKIKALDYNKSYHGSLGGNFEVLPQVIVYPSFQRKKCNEIRQAHGQYDIIIATRPDLIPGEPLDPKIFEYAKDQLLIPLGSDWDYGISDLLVIGPPKLVNVYCALYQNIIKYLKRGVILHPEHILKYHLDYLNIPISRFSYVTHLITKRMT